MGRTREEAGGAAPGRILFCDTNVLVRILTGDPPEQARAAAGALEAAAAGRFTLLLPDLVLAEVAYVLTSAGMGPAEAAEHLGSVMDLPGVQVEDEPLLRDVVDLWAGGRLDFADAYLAGLSRRVNGSGVLSFDRDLDRVPGVDRVNPATVR